MVVASVKTPEGALVEITDGGWKDRDKAELDRLRAEFEKTAARLCGVQQGRLN